MAQIATWMDDVVAVAEGGDERSIDRVRGEIGEFVNRSRSPGGQHEFPLPSVEGRGVAAARAEGEKGSRGRAAPSAPRHPVHLGRRGL